jgi:phage FluMu protein Com
MRTPRETFHPRKSKAFLRRIPDELRDEFFNERRNFLFGFLVLDISETREDDMNEHRCQKCKKLMMAMTDRTGRTELQCLKCDKVDPMKTDAVKWANSGLSGPTNVA